MAKNDKRQFQRQNMRHKLALAWLKTHRMDVYEVIQEEIDKNFPPAHKKIKVILPDSLKNLE